MLWVVCWEKIMTDFFTCFPKMKVGLSNHQSVHGYITTNMSFLPYSKVHALVTMVTSDKIVCDVTMETQQC
jgi:hypothetical protein